MYSKELEKGYLEKKVDLSLDLFQEIKYLQQKKNAVILAHYYQDADIQDIANYIGDSLGLAQEAQKTDALDRAGRRNRARRKAALRRPGLERATPLPGRAIRSLRC